MTIPAAALSAYQFYLSRGLAPLVAAGIVGVLNYESGLVPTAENNSGTDAGGILNPKGAYGDAQWNGARQTALKTFATEKGLDPAASETQLLFVLTEAANSYPAVWAAIQAGANQTLESFIATFVTRYENPRLPAPEEASALSLAQALLASGMSASAPAPAPAPPPAVAGGDPELTAIGVALAALAALPASGVARALAYIEARLGVAK